MSITEADGAIIVDDKGNEYLDFLSQLCCVNLGHSNDTIIESMTEQLSRVQYVSPGADNDVRTLLAEELVELGPENCSDVIFSISGSEANELASFIARRYSGASKVMSRYRSYHGVTLGAGSLTGGVQTRAPIEQSLAMPGSVKFLPPLSYRSPFSAGTPEELAEDAGDHLEYVIKNEGPDTISALITEVVGGSSGAYPPPPGYFDRVRELCDEHEILLILDEVLTGFGRCGEWFAHETEGIQPDIMTFAKGVTGAHAPLAGVFVRDDIGTWLRTEGIDIGQTFGGHVVSCAAGVAALDEYRSGFIDRVQKHAPFLERQLQSLENRHDVVGDVRGRGFLWSIEFTDPNTDEPFVDPTMADEADMASNPVSQVVNKARENGVHLLEGRPEFQIIVGPPFCVTKEQIETAIEVLDDAIVGTFS